MTNYERIIKMNEDELAKFIAETNTHGNEETPWDKWMCDTFCNEEKCPSIKNKDGYFPCTYCEVHHECCHLNMAWPFEDEQIIKVWLQQQRN